jgi:PAS domain S-box-containing protein
MSLSDDLTYSAVGKTVLDALDQQIAVLDCYGVIVAVNASWQRYAVENSPGKEAPAGHTQIGTNYLHICRASKGVAADGAREVAAGITAVLDGSLPNFTLEYPCDSPTEQRWFIMRATPTDESPRRAVIAHSDNTGRRRAEIARYHEYQHREAVLMASSDGIHILNAEGILINANQAFLTMLGLDHSAIGTLRVDDWNVHESWASILAQIDGLFESRQPVIIETQHRCSDGRTIDVEISACCVSIGGEVFIYSASRDITVRKQAEAELSRYRHHLEEQVAERTLTVRSMATEIMTAEARERRILAAELHDNLGQNLALIKLKLASLAGPVEGAARVDHLQDMKTITDLLDQANASVRSLSTQLSPLVLSKFGLVAALESLTEDFLRVWGLRVSVHLCDELTLDNTTAAALFRIVRELLLNILKHARVSEATLIMTRDADSGMLEISVADEGIGFDAEKTLAARTNSGYGLGSIRERIEFLGGKMLIDSQMGNGTIVSLTLMPEPVGHQ